MIKNDKFLKEQIRPRTVENRAMRDFIKNNKKRWNFNGLPYTQD